MRAQLLRSAAGPLPASARLPCHYLLEVASAHERCEVCQLALRRQRSAIHYPVGLMLGRPRVRSVEKQCPNCGRVYRCEDYARLVPPHGNHAFDLVVEIGLAAFVGHRQYEEIQRRLEAHWGLRLSCSTIREQAQSFLDYLAATHEAHLPELRAQLDKDGGYVLHVDGTREADSDVVFSALAGNRAWTLAGCKMATEDATRIEELLRRCVEWFGPPLALVRDLSPQIEAAHLQVMPDVPDLICHYHFLENVGTKLCERHHSRLMACLRRAKIRPALSSLRHDLVRHTKRKGGWSPARFARLLAGSEEARKVDPVQRRRAWAYLLLLWLEDYKADLRGEFFPFDLPALALYRRCRTIYAWLQAMAESDVLARELPTLETIRRHLAPVVHDQEIVTAAERLEKAASLFDELRAVLRLCSDGRRPLLHHRAVPDGPVQARQREQQLERWIEQLRRRQAAESDADRASDCAIVLSYLEKYHRKLVGHVIFIDGRAQPFIVQRTNNLIEHQFARKKHGLRRKLGNKSLARSVRAMRPEELLVDNLDNADYLQIICGGSLENLAYAFAANWQRGQQFRAARRATTISRPIPVNKKTLRDDGFLSNLGRAVIAALQKAAIKDAAA